MEKLSERLRLQSCVSNSIIEEIAGLERQLDTMGHHVIELEQRLDTDPHIKADVYDHLTELLEPYIQREGKEGGFLPASVTDSVSILLEQCETLPDTLSLITIYRSFMAHLLSVIASENFTDGYRNQIIDALNKLAGPDVPIEETGARLMVLERAHAIQQAVEGARAIMAETLSTKTELETKQLEHWTRGYGMACDKLNDYAERLIAREEVATDEG